MRRTVASLISNESLEDDLTVSAVALEEYYSAALHALADEIGLRLRVEPEVVLDIMDSMPSEWLPLLEDWDGWRAIADAVSDKLDRSASVLPTRIN
jgi:intein/homing endonuclease